MLNWIEPRTRWSKLRLLGVSPIVKSTALMPFLGYIILLNDKLINWMNVNVAWLPGSTSFSIAGWRIFFLFYGALLLGIGSALFSWRCPLTIKKYDSAVEFVGQEQGFFWPLAHYTHLVARLRSEILTDLQRSLPELANLDKELSSATRQDSRENSQDHLAVLMTMFWHIRNTREQNWRCLIYLLFMAGAILVTIPSVVTIAQVTWATILYWL